MILSAPRSPSSAGALLRDWRVRRRLSQLECALEAEISQKHLSFIESGRARPSREMVLHLTERLGVPLRERNAIMLAAGYAPAFPARDLSDPALAPARAAIAAILKAHEPYPALAFDRRWDLIDANAGVARLLTLVTDMSLLRPPVNVLRLSFAPAAGAAYRQSRSMACAYSGTPAPANRRHGRPGTDGVARRPCAPRRARRTDRRCAGRGGGEHRRAAPAAHARRRARADFDDHDFRHAGRRDVIGIGAGNIFPADDPTAIALRALAGRD